MPASRRGKGAIQATGAAEAKPAPTRGRARREAALEPLAPVDRLPGLGPSGRRALAEHGVRTVVDLVWTPPSGWDDLRAPRSLAEVVASATDGPVRATFAAVVESASMMPFRRRRCVRVVLCDAVDSKCKLHAFWFFTAHGVLALAKPGTAVLATARVTAPPDKPPRAAHPELVVDVPEARTARPRYPRLGPSGALVRKAIAHAVRELAGEAAGATLDPVPTAIAAREGMRDAAGLLRSVHATTGELPGDDERRALVERLAWAEAFTRAWERRLAEEGLTATPAHPLPPAPAALRRLERELGFTLTDDQRRATSDVARDLADTRPMRRLVLGDVGTGKTAIALAAVAQCVAAGRQAAILAPTSVLAEQYLAAVRPLERATGARVAFVAAGTTAPERARAEAELASGEASVAIGTHALLGEGVSIPRLSLVVVDEQQRLGVGQRLALVKKGERPHLLTLSATPIPRTLALALRGELATSTLRVRPAGREPVATRLVARAELTGVVGEVRAAAGRGERVFWIVPRVEPSDDDDDDADELASAEARRKALAKGLGAAARVGLIHGSMSAGEKRAAMSAFRSGETPVLVGTTVVEVGVDVPEATLIVVEDAERYGLAQLHQLRGRVGRGERPGACVLLHGDRLEGVARRRLVALTRLESGEEVARADLALRGAGDLGGTRQHGEEDELVYLDPGAEYSWLERVDADAREIRAVDPALEQPDHRVLGSIVGRLRRALAVREEAG
ncbi:MAG: DEAD/DEAH box helicase [Labilithrix sp.]|nr:DEAD/DEAH box helicase [Labilithrix sp.]